MSMSKSSKMSQYINYRMRATIQDGRQMVGKLTAFDRHMNLALGDCEEFRKLPLAKGAAKKGEEREDRRTMGFMLLRGEEVISITVEDPPPPDENRAKASGAGGGAGGGLGLGRAAGRGIPSVSLVVQAQPGLSGPVRGVGGPAPGMMQPQISRPPVPMGYVPPPVVRPGQMGFLGQMRPPPQFQRPLRGGPPGPGQYQVPPGQGQYAQRMPGPPPQMMRGPPPPAGGGPPRMPPPGVFGPPRPGMAPPQNNQQ